MSFPFNLYVLAFICAFAVSSLTLPLWRRFCFWLGFVDDPGLRKIHYTQVPLAGGLAVYSAIVLPMLAACLWFSIARQGIFEDLAPLDPVSNSALQYGLTRRSLQLLAIAFGATGLLIIGLLDDFYELRPSVKFAGQVVVALVVALAGVRVTLFVPNAIISCVLTVFWILTVVNAFNFMDNMNGLCAGLGIIGAWYFAIAAAAKGQYLVASLCFLAAGALLGFLLYNFPKARAFLGDSGSHLVGFLLAIMAILPHFYTTDNERYWAVLIPLFILGVPLFDLAWVVLLRWRIGQPFYQGDNNHLSHRLVRAGYSRTTAVLLIWLVAATVGWVTLIL